MSMIPHRRRKKVLDTLLAQISALDGIPDSAAGKEMASKVPTMVHRLSRHLPDLEQIKAIKKHSKMRSEKDLKVFLVDLAHDLNEGMELIEVAKALQKSGTWKP